MQKQITTYEKAQEIKREIKMRKRVYPFQVLQCKMKQDVADRNIAIMEAILKDYQVILEKEDPQGKLL